MVLHVGRYNPRVELHCYNFTVTPRKVSTVVPSSVSSVVQWTRVEFFNFLLLKGPGRSKKSTLISYTYVCAGSGYGYACGNRDDPFCVDRKPQRLVPVSSIPETESAVGPRIISCTSYGRRPGSVVPTRDCESRFGDGEHNIQDPSGPNCSPLRVSGDWTDLQGVVPDSLGLLY